MLGLLFFTDKSFHWTIFANMKNLFSLICGFRIPDSGFRFLVSGSDSGFWFRFPVSGFRLPAFRVAPCNRSQIMSRCVKKKTVAQEATLLSTTDLTYYLRNRKHVPCFYRVIQTRVEVWENEKCCGKTSRRRVFPQLFRVLPNFHECLYNSIEKRSTCFLFHLENVTRKRKTTC